MTRTIDEGALRTETLENGDQIHLEASDGSHIPIELHARVIDIDGESWVYSITRDISERKQRELELERQRDRLENFAEIISHDIRNPLNVAQIRLEMVLAEFENEHLETIGTALDRIEAIIGDTLELAKLGQATMESESIDLESVVSRSGKMVETSNATIEFADTKSKSIKADPNRVRLLFENLIRNAAEHSDGHVQIRVGTMESGFYLEDDGPGIPEGQREDVFETGYSSADGGTGFGLSIVKEVAHAHGFSIRVKEGSDGGARFEITGVDFAAKEP